MRVRPLFLSSFLVILNTGAFAGTVNLSEGFSESTGSISGNLNLTETFTTTTVDTNTYTLDTTGLLRGKVVTNSNFDLQSFSNGQGSGVRFFNIELDFSTESLTEGYTLTEVNKGSDNLERETYSLGVSKGSGFGTAEGFLSRGEGEFESYSYSYGDGNINLNYNKFIPIYSLQTNSTVVTDSGFYGSVSMRSFGFNYSSSYSYVNGKSEQTTVSSY